MATKTRKSAVATEQPIVLSQESGQVYTDPMVVRLWGDYSARYQQSGLGKRTLIDTYLGGYSTSGPKRLRTSPRLGLGDYGTMPRERALLVMPGYEYFKSNGMPAETA